MEQVYHYGDLVQGVKLCGKGSLRRYPSQSVSLPGCIENPLCCNKANGEEKIGGWEERERDEEEGDKDPRPLFPPSKSPSLQTNK
jgi:hypothetical protein